MDIATENLGALPTVEALSKEKSADFGEWQIGTKDKATASVIMDPRFMLEDGGEVDEGGVEVEERNNGGCREIDMAQRATCLIHHLTQRHIEIFQLWPPTPPLRRWQLSE